MDLERFARPPPPGAGLSVPGPVAAIALPAAGPAVTACSEAESPPGRAPRRAFLWLRLSQALATRFYQTHVSVARCRLCLYLAHRWQTDLGTSSWEMRELPPPGSRSLMPRYFFHVRDGSSSPDDVGTELANWHEARIEAVRFAGEVIRDHAHRIALSQDWHIEVTDEHQIMLFRLDLITTDSPALADRRCNQRHSI